MIRYLAGLAAALVVAAPARAEPPVWIVKDADSEMVIFGSVHVLPPGLTWRPARLDAALGKADDIWFELPVGPAAEQEVARLAMTLGMLPPDRSLYAMLPPSVGQRLSRVADAYGVDKQLLDRMEPWLAEVALAAAGYARAGALAQYGVEATVNAATPQKVERKALETPAEQLDLFDASPLPDQIASLAETLRELETEPNAFFKLVDAWRTGETRKLDEEALQPLRVASPNLFERLVTRRNANWTRELDARLRGSGRTVVVVGVGHLVGSDGVPARLRALGYSVTGP
jgi:uncharacterized protein YbaP (TraB family)